MRKVKCPLKMKKDFFQVWGENKGNRIIIDTVSRLILNYYLDISIFKEILLAIR